MARSLLPQFLLKYEYISTILLMLVIFSNIAEGCGKDVFKEDDICVLKECYTEVDAIKINRKPGAKPCGDFYKFVCGGWQQRNPIPSDQTRWNQFMIVTNVTNFRIKEILEMDDKIEDLESLKTARKFYRSCLHAHDNSNYTMKIFTESLLKWGGWPIITNDWKKEDFNWKKLLVNLEQISTDFSSLISLAVEPNRKNTTTLVITIDQASLPFCPYFSSDDDNQLAVAKLIFGTVNELAGADNNTVLDQLVEDTLDMLNFTIKVCAIEKPISERLDEFKSYNPKTLQELQKLTDDLNVEQTYSKVDWLELINDYLEGSGMRLSKTDTVIVKDFDYVSQIIHLIDKTPQRTLANYMLWHRTASVQKYLSTKMRTIINQFDQLTSGSTSTVTAWWQNCAEDTNDFFEHAVGYEYVKLYFDDEQKEKATELVQNILDSFIEELKGNEWMDDSTRILAVEKAENMVPVVGYPDWYKNTSRVNRIYGEIHIDKKAHFENIENAVLGTVRYYAKLLPAELSRFEFVMGPAVINAGYFPTANVMNIPAGIFQPPFYFKGRPETLNYGAIGSIIGHEVNHAFDVQGRTGDKYGNLVDWWSPETLEKYLQEEDCFEKQYNEYPVPELSSQKEVTHLDGKGTIGENMADNGGLQIAFKAYRKYVGHHGKEKRLPGLTDYSADQLFFIGFGTMWCENRDNKSLVQDILTDVHTPLKYRVLVPLGNSEDFAKAWNCPIGSTMNPHQKCRLW